MVNEAHRFALHDAEGHLVGPVQLMSAVHLALEAWLLPDGVIWPKLWRDHPEHWGKRFREDEGLENRPSRTQQRDKKKPSSNRCMQARGRKCLEGKTKPCCAAFTQPNRHYNLLIRTDFSFTYVYRRLKWSHPGQTEGEKEEAKRRPPMSPWNSIPKTTISHLNCSFDIYF